MNGLHVVGRSASPGLPDGGGVIPCSQLPVHPGPLQLATTHAGRAVVCRRAYRAQTARVSGKPSIDAGGAPM